MKIAEVVDAGQRSLIVGPADESRCAVGLPPGGPFDADAAEIANRAVGNPQTAAVLECAAVGPGLRFLGDGLLAWCGADGLVQQYRVREGERFAIGRIREGMRGVLAVRGGWANPGPAFDLEPSVLRRGDVLESAQCEVTSPRIATIGRTARRVVGALAGPHQVEAALLDVLRESVWRVTPQLDRAAVRLCRDGDVPALQATLPTCGMQFGTVQWHPGGELVAMGPDHPVTGGYLQVITILSTERWKLAHLAPGEGVRFVIGPSTS